MLLRLLDRRRREETDDRHDGKQESDLIARKRVDGYYRW